MEVIIVLVIPLFLSSFPTFFIPPILRFLVIFSHSSLCSLTLTALSTSMNCKAHIGSMSDVVSHQVFMSVANLLLGPSHRANKAQEQQQGFTSAY